jgi:hypothetical protein
VSATTRLFSYEVFKISGLPIEHNAPFTSETADNYHAVVTYLTPIWRVISDYSLQWIVQHREPNGKSARPWRALGYHTERAALIARCRGIPGINAGALAALEALPPRFPHQRPCDEFDIAAWITGTRLCGPINHKGQLGLLVPVSVVADELEIRGIWMTQEAIRAAIKQAGIANYR